MFQTQAVEKIKAHILYSITLFFFFLPRKSFRLGDSLEKYCRAGQTTDDSTYQTANALCILGNLGHTHTHTHSEYIILIAFLRQQLLHERA